jgi:hypothetical protein
MKSKKSEKNQEQESVFSEEGWAVKSETTCSRVLKTWRHAAQKR